MESLIKFSHYGEERAFELSEDEQKFVELIYEILKDTPVNIGKLKIVRKSDSYTTIVVKGKEWDFDLIRFKFTERTKWLSLQLSREDRITFENDVLFDAQKKKTQLHWKSKMSSINESSKYKQLIVNSYSEITNSNQENFC